MRAATTNPIPPIDSTRLVASRAPRTTRNHPPRRSRRVDAASRARRASPRASPSLRRRLERRVFSRKTRSPRETRRPTPTDPSDAPEPLPTLRFAANALLALAPPPQRTCSAQGGALHVVSDPLTTLQVIERDDLILACVSERVSAAALLARYDATDDGDTRRRVNALRDALGDLHDSDGAFAVVLFDAAAGRVMAARTANSLPLSYGFTADGVLVACAGLTAERLMPGAGMDLTPLPSGRFVFGHRYVKPIEFTKFWSTASANRSAAPARKARRSVDGFAAPARRVSTVVEESDLEAAAANEDAAPTASRWGRTGSVGDDAREWTSPAPSVGELATTAPPREGAYVPPARRAALAAAKKAEEEAKAKAKAEEEAKVKAAAAAAAAEAASGAVSPRTKARKSEADAQVARALEAEEMVVSSLENALAAAVSGEVRRRQSIDAHARPTRRPLASSLRSTTLDGSSWSLALAAQRRSAETRVARSSLDCGRRQSLESRSNFERIAAQRLMGV